jgi:IS30 family transposase
MKMTIKSDTIKEAKSALKSMSKKSEKRLTKADFVESLIKDIHEKMEAGFSIAEICQELNKTLPSDKQIKLNTFKTYVRTARKEAGIKPLRTWTRKTEAAPMKIEKPKKEEDPKEVLETDFRDQGGDL